jgi:tetratricopeptide (TPR) repeat protein
VVAQAVLSVEGAPDRSSTPAGAGMIVQDAEALTVAEVVPEPKVASHPSGKTQEPQAPPLPSRGGGLTLQPRGDPAQTASKTPTDTQSAAVSDPLLSSRRETLPSGMVDILKTTRRDPVNEQVFLAYEAFVRKDFPEALQGYMKVLDSDPNNRDALAGLGAIAVVFSRLDEANRIYARMLERDPLDAVAQAGLLACNTNTPENEARIKTLLERQPGAHFLHFALANQYVAQSRWPEAQQAFFDAFRLDPENPDYAFNLAVSLEHLRQPRLAAEHYQRALNLSERRPSAFDQNTARTRVRQLNGVSGP